jgi:hypothetical protein
MRRTSIIWLSALLLGGCVQYVGDVSGTEIDGSSSSGSSGRPGGSSGASSSSSGAASSSGTSSSGGPVVLDCSQPKAAVTRLRLLSETQYNNSVLDLLQVPGPLAKGLGQKLDDTSLEQRATAAASVASQAVATLSKWAPCTASTTACEQQIIDKVGARLYRRPLTDAERAELKTLFDAGLKEKDFSTGVEWFLTGVLQAPDFMYQVVRPAATESPGDIRPLSGHEYASRLAYFIWDGPPDDALLTAAANNELADPTKREAQVTRMLQDARFSRGYTQFYRKWLKLDAFAELARNATGFDQNVVSALSTSLLMSATQLYSSQSPNISSLFSGDKYYLNDALRTFYGVSGTGTGFTLTAMSGQPRRGILTHPGLMALLARPDETYPIGRGLFLLRNIICKTVPNPAVPAIPQPPLTSDTVSTRERLEMHTAAAACMECHGMINAAGFVFENIDQVGRSRAMDGGKPVNTSGELAIGKDTDGSFASGDEILNKLTDSQDVRACFAEKYLNFALSHDVTDAADGCSIQSLGKTFAASGDLKKLVAMVAGTDSFRLRLAEGVGK